MLPTVRSYYLLWLEKHKRRVPKEIAPWGLAMVSVTWLKAMNAIFINIFLTTTARGGGGYTSAQRDARLLMQAMRQAFLLKELPQWVGGAHKASVHIEALPHILREFEAMGTE